MAKQVTVTQGWSNPCVAPTLTQGKAVVTLHHVMSPCCWWSWGYLGALARVRLVYGNQVDLNLAWAVPYTDVNRYYEHSELTDAKTKAWAKESGELMGVPMFTDYSKAGMAKDLTPALLATVAALRQGRPLGERFARGLMRRNIVEGVDVTARAVLREAAKETALDLRRFERDLGDREGLEKEIRAQDATLPNLPLGFYNLILEDAKGRKIVLDHAFDPAPIEEAIDWLSGGKLVKNAPNDPAAFLRATGPAPTIELARAFAWTPTETDRRLGQLAKQGEVRRVDVGGAPHWDAA